jgi:hypothetical protein
VAVLLRVDPRVLRAIGSELRDATAVASEVADRGRGLLGEVADCGHDGVGSASTRFLDRWAYGARCMAGDAGALAAILLEAEEAYLDVDAAVLEELTS